MTMAKHKNEDGDEAIPEQGFTQRKRRKSSVVNMKEPYANVKRSDLSETLAAIGFKPEAGEIFDQIAKDWYARFRPGRVLSIITSDEEKFNYMILDFVIKYGPDFWPRENRNHCTNNGSSSYRPGDWRRGVGISFVYPRDSIFRAGAKQGKVRNITQAVRREEQIDSFIHKALKPYFVGLHYHGRGPNEDKDPKGFEAWPISKAQVTACLVQLKAIPKKSLGATSPPKPSRERVSFHESRVEAELVQDQEDIRDKDYVHLSNDDLINLALQRGLTRANLPGIHRNTILHLLGNFNIAQEQYGQSKLTNDPQEQQNTKIRRGQLYYQTLSTKTLAEIVRERGLWLVNPGMLSNHRQSIVQCLMDYDDVQAMAGATLNDVRKDSVVPTLPPVHDAHAPERKSSENVSTLEPFPSLAPSPTPIQGSMNGDVDMVNLTSDPGSSIYHTLSLDLPPNIATSMYHGADDGAPSASAPELIASWYNPNTNATSNSAPSHVASWYHNSAASGNSPPTDTSAYMFQNGNAIASTFLRKDSATQIPTQITATSLMADPNMAEKLRWQQKMNEIEAQAEARKNSVIRKGVVRADGRWEFPN